MNIFFNRLVKEKEEASNQPDWDPTAEKAAWLSRLDGFLACIKSWLAPALKNKTVKITSKPFQIEEDHLGLYQANGLLLDFGYGRQVEVKPVKGVCVGAKGRVYLHFHGCKSNGVVEFLFRPDHWVVWPNAEHLRKAASAICAFDEEYFLSLLNRMV